MKRILFICGKAKQRSPTAEHIFAELPNVETDSAGLSTDSDIVLSSEQIEWASDTVVMEKSQLRRLKTKYGKHTTGKRIVCFDIADNYDFMQEELIALLKQRIGRVL